MTPTFRPTTPDNDECFLCERPYKYGPHRYDGRWLPTWGVGVCRNCLRSNWDGLVLQRHPRIVLHLNERGVELALNANGHLKWPE